jgi:hypothetical protein
MITNLAIQVGVVVSATVDSVVTACAIGPVVLAWVIAL